jgi:hypothetical protein
VGSTSSAPSSPRQVIGPNGQTQTISERTALRVWVAAGGRCTMCNRRLVDDAYTGADVSVGQLAHIVGWSTASGSPRGGDKLPVDERNDEANLMLLCYDQHRVIDNRSMWDVFDVDMLRGMKRSHEQRIAQLTAIEPPRPPPPDRTCRPCSARQLRRIGRPDASHDLQPRRPCVLSLSAV